MNAQHDTKALLLTDVVDSTQLSEALGDAAMARVWTDHDRVARDLLPPWRGREIDKTDGMLLLFDAAADAVGYAQAYHRALAALPVPLRARAGLHVGPVLLRENAAADVLRGAKPLEVDGLAKPTAARVMAIARGGQTLLSAEARAALGTPDGCRLDSHGHWMMKGLSAPVEIFEVGPPEQLPTAPPDGDKVYRVVQVDGRWLPVQAIPNNLPQQSTPFIGREQELRDIKALLGSARLVTLLGMGGLGKTRLSLQAAAELMHQFPDGVWFLDLAPISDPALALAEAAQVLGVREEPERSLLQSVCSFLQTRRVLMVFDNCEHLIKPAAEMAHAIVRAAPHVRLAASSREALRIPGEHAYLVQPLPVPRAGDDLATLRQSTAVRLFVARAQAHRPGFELDEAQAPAVAELVARLEGIPLALELVAARLRTLSLADINRRLGNRFKLLTGGSQVLQQRQQSLRALVDWSYDLLPEAEQLLLQRLAVFRGGLDMEAAEAVCGGTPLDVDAVLDLLGALVEKSLLMQAETAEGMRYQMLETIREYALEKLAAAGTLEAMGGQHGAHYFAFAKLGRDGLHGPQQGYWLGRLETEQDNLRAATGYALGPGGNPILALKLAVALQGFWILRGYSGEGRALLRGLLALPAVQADAQAHAHALYVAAALAWSQSDHAAALADLQTCLALRRQRDNPFDVAATLSTLALTRLGCADAAGALAADHEALQLFQLCGNQVGEATVQLQLGQIHAWCGAAAQAATHLQAALQLARQIKHLETEAEAELSLAQLDFEAGALGAAEAGLARSLKICLAAGDRRGAAHALWWLGKLDLLAGRQAPACERLAEALSAFNAFDMREHLLGCLEDHAALGLLLEQPQAAIALASCTQQLRENARLTRPRLAQGRWQALLARLRAASPDEAFFEAPWQQARDWDTAQALRRALTLALPAGRLH